MNLSSNFYSSMNVRTPDHARRGKAIKTSSHRSSSYRKRKAKPVLLIFAAIALMALLSHQITSKLFLVRDISILGCQRLSQQDVLDVLNIEIGNDSILKVSIPYIEKKLEEELSLVKDALVSKKVIRGILEVNLVEREAIALLRYHTEDGYYYLLIDPQGVLLEKHDSVERLENLTMIVGVEDLPWVESGQRLNVDSVHLALSVIEQSKLNGLYSRISAVNANDPNKILLQLKNEFVAIISADSIEEGLRNISLILGNEKHELPSYEDGNYLDARFKDVVYQGRD